MGSVSRFGFWSSLAAFAACAGYSVVQIMQVVGLVVFPLDDILIFGFSILIPVPFVLAMVALFHSVPEEMRLWAHAAIVLGALYAVLAIIVYSTQLDLVVPTIIAGDRAQVQFLTVSKGSFMWVIDGAGYILMGLSTLFAAGVFAGSPEQRPLKRLLIANGLIDPIIIAVYIMPSLLLLGSLWIITAPGSLLLLARYFKNLDGARP